MCKWIIDLEASKDMTLDMAPFDTHDIIALRNKHLDTNSIVETIGMGFIVMEAIMKGNINQIRIKDMHHVSMRHASLHFMNKLVSNDLRIQFNLNKWIVKSCNGAPYKGLLYEINLVNVNKADATNLVQSPMGDDMLELWHRRLSHLYLKGVHILQNMVTDMNLGKFSCPTYSLLYKTCIEGKQHRDTFPNKSRR